MKTDTALTKQLAARLDELERANTRLENEMAALRAARPAPAGPPQSRRAETPHEVKTGRASRRGLLRTAVGVAAATVGAGALLEAQSGAALATGAEGPTTFSSATGTPTVTIKNTSSGEGLRASSSSGDGVHSVINTAGKFAVLGEGHSGVGVGGSSDATDGVFGTTGSGNGVHGQVSTAASVGVRGTNTGGGFGVFCDGNFAATGTKNALVPLHGSYAALYCLVQD
jgi:hypothetical protein